MFLMPKTGVSNYNVSHKPVTEQVQLSHFLSTSHDLSRVDATEQKTLCLYNYDITIYSKG